jgi:hypothetical protein
LAAWSPFEGHLIAFGEGLESFAGNGGKMHEYVFAVLPLDKTKPLAVVKPLHRTIFHFVLSPNP